MVYYFFLIYNVSSNLTVKKHRQNKMSSLWNTSLMVLIIITEEDCARTCALRQTHPWRSPNQFSAVSKKIYTHINYLKLVRSKLPFRLMNLRVKLKYSMKSSNILPCKEVPFKCWCMLRALCLYYSYIPCKHKLWNPSNKLTYAEGGWLAWVNLNNQSNSWYVRRFIISCALL